ncbi:CaiB/BaiF CoA transferase family protein [Piscinibacter koreensis]|uniref:CoA transferase n=1 Tax=Piscinibacter koreensis TaxID=2742824 RepID=A0A7Y6NKC4_9BURK|nr:CoA transferase [Schlegelella koreensis]NUZ04694.1 CoA transferase [Schlegelella koreensis]
MPDAATIRQPSGATPGEGPLAGMRVLEMGSTVAGPFCGRLLADFGAEVIKIEPAEGDPVRTMGKRFEGKSLYAASIFRNKQLVSIDLRQPEGQRLAADLTAASDVVVENFKPGGLEKWGLGWSDLSARNPGLVMVRISGFGQDGPYSQRAGYGVVGEAMSGLRHLTGDPDRPPSRVAVSMTDYITGLYAAFGAALALLARARTGRGQYIDAALYESAFSFMEPWIPAYQKLGHVATRTGSRLPESTPNNLYPTGDDSFIHITAMGDAVFRRLVGTMGRPELASDPRFADGVSRSAHHEVLDELIGEWTSERRLADLESVLAAAGVPATRIYTIADIFADPHFAARRSIVEAPDDALGGVAMATVVPRLSATPGAVRHAGHRVGQDTRRVLAGVLGLSNERIDALAAAGVVTCDDRQTGEQPA